MAKTEGIIEAKRPKATANIRIVSNLVLDHRSQSPEIVLLSDSSRDVSCRVVHLLDYVITGSLFHGKHGRLIVPHCSS